MGFERGDVADWLAAGFDVRWLAQRRGVGRARAPGLAVVVGEHRPAPVELRLGRRFIFELNAEGNGAGLDQVVHRAGRHLVGKPGKAGIGVLR